MPVHGQALLCVPPLGKGLSVRGCGARDIRCGERLCGDGLSPVSAGCCLGGEWLLLPGASGVCLRGLGDMGRLPQGGWCVQNTRIDGRWAKI